MLGREREEDNDVDELERDAEAIDGEYEDTMGLDEGHAIEDPEQAVEERAHVRQARELFGRTFLHNLVKRRPDINKHTINTYRLYIYTYT